LPLSFSTAKWKYDLFQKAIKLIPLGRLSPLLFIIYINWMDKRARSQTNNECATTGNCDSADAIVAEVQKNNRKKREPNKQKF